MPPFDYDLSQLFNIIMQKTLMDFQFGNNGGLGNGFCGGFMNSCWGAGFQAHMWGDSYSFSGGGSSSLTPEEAVDRQIAQNKFTSLKSVVQEWVNTLSDSREDLIIKEEFRRIGSYSEDNYAKLKEMYNTHKAAIQAKVKNTVKIEPKQASKDAATSFKTESAKSTPDFSKILEKEGDPAETKAELKSGVDALEFLYELQNNNKKSFKDLYNTACRGASETQKKELQKLLKAVYNGLVAKAADVAGKDGVSDEAKEAINKLRDIATDNATAQNVDQLYYWIRIATAEAADKKYACLNEDFPDDPLLGKADNVKNTKAGLKAEGVDVEHIPSQTIVTDYSDVSSSKQALEILEERSFVKSLSATQLTALNNISGVKTLFPKGVKKAWVDNSSRLNYCIIRVIDKDGNMKYITGVGLKGGKIQAIGGEIKLGQSIEPEKIEQISKTLADVKDAIDAGTLVEVKDAKSTLGAAGKDVRVFIDKVATNANERHRVFFVDSDGKLKELPYIYYNEKDKKFYTSNSEKQSEKTDVAISDIATAVDKKKNDVSETSTTARLNVSSDSIQKGENYYTSLNDPTASNPNLAKNIKKDLTTDSVVGILKGYREKSGGKGGLMTKLQSFSTKYSPGFCSRIPKMLMRKAQEMGTVVTNTDAYKKLVEYYGAQGTSVCQNGMPINGKDTFKFTKNDGNSGRLTESDARNLDKMIYALLDEMLKYAS